MNLSFLKNFSIEKSLIFIIIAAVIIFLVFVGWLIFGSAAKSIKLVFPTAGTELSVGKKETISWKSIGINKVGIALFKDKETEWIAQNVQASAGKYEWEIQPGKEYGDGYWIAVFEYPWKSGNKISYSQGSFAITYEETLNCDALSANNEWPYFPSTFPNLRRVFITSGTYKGNLGGFQGADQICQKEAEQQNFQGSWHAFLGGDNEEEIAIARLNQTVRKIEGVFVEAGPETTLLNGSTCHRLLGKDFNEFFGRFSELAVVSQDKISGSFSEGLKNIWLGRVDQKSEKNCIKIFGASSGLPIAETYSFTSTCQNWTKEDRYVLGYPVPRGESKPAFPTCYTPQGRFTDAVVLGGLATGLTGGGTGVNYFTPYQAKSCFTAQKLLCIEE